MIPVRFNEWCGRLPEPPLFGSALRFQNFPKATQFDHLDPNIAVKQTRMIDIWHYAVSLAVMPWPDLKIHASYRRDRLTATEASETLDLFGAALEMLLELGESPIALVQIPLDAVCRRLEIRGA